MNPQSIIIEQIGLSLESFQLAAESLSELLEQTGEVMSDCLLNDGKIVLCGMGGSGTLAANFSTKMLSRFERDRPALPALTLNTDGIVTSGISKDSGHGDIYARQIRALCHEPDVLVVISASGSASALVKAIQAAHEQGICVIALTSSLSVDVATLLSENDIELRIDSDKTSSIDLTHHLLLNCLMDLIEHAIFGSEL